MTNSWWILPKNGYRITSFEKDWAINFWWSSTVVFSERVVSDTFLMTWPLIRRYIPDTIVFSEPVNTKLQITLTTKMDSNYGLFRTNEQNVSNDRSDIGGFWRSSFQDSSSSYLSRMTNSWRILPKNGYRVTSFEKDWAINFWWSSTVVFSERVVSDTFLMTRPSLQRRICFLVFMIPAQPTVNDTIIFWKGLRDKFLMILNCCLFRTSGEWHILNDTTLAAKKDLFSCFHDTCSTNC